MPPFQQVAPGEFLFQGRTDLDDFNQVMASHISKDTAETLGGLIYALIGRVPAEGETVEVDGLTLRVEQVTGRRIRSVSAIRHAVESEEKEKEHDSEQ
jgi:Mg2+/Co2+ transporter CorC